MTTKTNTTFEVYVCDKKNPEMRHAIAFALPPVLQPFTYDHNQLKAMMLLAKNAAAAALTGTGREATGVVAHVSLVEAE